MTAVAEMELPATRRSPLARLLLFLVRAYRTVPKSPLPRCRFAPSCSAYALTAIEVHGAARGGILALGRIARCHPFHPGGVDHVPTNLIHSTMPVRRLMRRAAR